MSQGKQKDFVVACNLVSHGCCDSRPNECWLLRSGRSGPPDLQTILQEFPGIDQEMALPLSKSELDGSKTGVQEPFDLSKAQHALGIHGVFR